MRPLRVFIIQPFKAGHSGSFREAVIEACSDKEFRGGFEAFHAEDTPSSEARLPDRIDEYLKSADICVADLYGTRNENVLLEVGASYTLGIPVIPFSDKELPSDIRGYLYAKLDLSKLGNESTRELCIQLLKQRLQEARKQIGRQNHSKYVAHVYKDRGAVDFHSLITRAERRLNILTTNLNYIVNEDLDRGPDEHPMTFLDVLGQQLHNKDGRFTLRILALDPDSNFTNERALSLSRNRQEFREQMRDDLNRVREFIESDRCPVDGALKIYEDYPLQMTFFFDDLIVSSVVATNLSSRYCVTYAHRLSELGARETYEQHFDQLWGKARNYAVSHGRKLRSNKQGCSG